MWLATPLWAQILPGSGQVLDTLFYFSCGEILYVRSTLLHFCMSSIVVSPRGGV